MSTFADSAKAEPGTSEDTIADQAREDYFTPMLVEILEDEDDRIEAEPILDAAANPDVSIDDVQTVAPEAHSVTESAPPALTPASTSTSSSTSLVIVIEGGESDSESLEDCGIEVKTERLEEYVNAHQNHDVRASTSASLESFDVQTPLTEAEEVESTTIRTALPPPILAPLAHLDVDVDIDIDPEGNHHLPKNTERSASVPTLASRTTSTQSMTESTIDSTPIMTPTQQSTTSWSERSDEYGGDEGITDSLHRNTHSTYIVEHTEETTR